MNGTECFFLFTSEFLKQNGQLRSTLSVAFGPSNYWRRVGNGCKQLDLWHAALGLAEHCVDKLQEPVVRLEDIGVRVNDALGLLPKSYGSFLARSQMGNVYFLGTRQTILNAG